MKRHVAYLKYVLRHKWYVFWAALRLGVPIWSALLHDWDKFAPDEWFPYARTFYTPSGKKQYVESVDFAHAWMKHQHRNKHHWQWWLWVDIPSHNCAIPLPKSNYLVWDRGEAQRIIERNSGAETWRELISAYPSDALVPDAMLDLYRREMLADWIGAGKALGKPNTWEWYAANKDKMQLHPDTREWVEGQMARLEHEHHLEMKRITLGL